MRQHCQGVVGNNTRILLEISFSFHGEKSLKIGSDFTKLPPWVKWRYFLEHSVSKPSLNGAVSQWPKHHNSFCVQESLSESVRPNQCFVIRWQTAGCQARGPARQNWFPPETWEGREVWEIKVMPANLHLDTLLSFHNHHLAMKSGQQQVTDKLSERERRDGNETSDKRRVIVIRQRAVISNSAQWSNYTGPVPVHVSDIVGRQRLRSASRLQLVVPRHRLTTLGRRAFAVMGPTSVWNSLPDDRPPSSTEQWLFLPAPEDFPVLSLLAYSAH